MSGSQLGEATSPGVPYWLPKGAYLATLTVEKTKAGDFTVVLDLAPMRIPDTGALYVLSHETLNVASDELDLEVGEKGLLTTVNTNADDQVGDILASTVEIAASVARLAAGIPGLPATRAAEPAATIDEALAQVAGTRQFVLEHPQDHQVVTGSVSLSLSTAPLGEKPPDCSEKPICDAKSDGVRFRVAAPHEATLQLDVTSDAGSLPPQTKTILAMVPDESATYVLPFHRVPFTTAVRNAKFEDGMLLGMHLERQSPVLGFVEIPLTIVRRIAQIPSELLTIRVQNAQSQASLVEAQLKAVQQAAELEQALSGAEAGSGAP